MQRPRVKVLKAVLDGLDVLLAQKVRPRRWKLRVLDLRSTGAQLGRMWCGCSTQERSLTNRTSPNMEHPLAPVEVFLDLNFKKGTGRSFSCTSSSGPSRGKGPVLQTLRVAEGPFQRGRQVPDAVQLDCILEVEVNCTWGLPTLGTFALYLGQMRNLQRLSLPHPHMLNLQHLRELDMDSPCFLQGRLDQVLRCLQTPLDKLSITNGWQLSHSDLTHLPTLRDLGLDNCAVVDSQVEAILPVLSRCHQLRVFTISENNFFLATVGKLLRHTAGCAV
ncbi:hypothetical protein QTO34_003357 [Cnephaeus nilssonii]|uniref:Uncharacterized protein n=1 Tax=Cnephaeus nilssonii TaxID=3371016 RepID=A0AA40LKI8_CNENI|nr:hypothetical protein QTO34_003357 [Eptesicus nilssonii]